MIERLTGTVCVQEEKHIVLMVHGIGFHVAVCDPSSFSLNQEVTVYTFVHYTQDKGISFFGFADEFSRLIFTHIISCPKIGPSIALSLLRQCSPADFVQIITSQNEAALSGFSGIGPKKAEQIVVSLKGPIGKLVSSGKLSDIAQGCDELAVWQHVSDALSSLHYSKQEIASAIAHIRETGGSDSAHMRVDVLLRKALGFLAQGADER